jgi:hypothetical protein
MRRPFVIKGLQVSLTVAVILSGMLYPLLVYGAKPTTTTSVVITTTSTTTTSCPPGNLINYPALDLTGSWIFTPTVVGGKNVGGTLSLYNIYVNTSVISSTEYYLSNTPGVEEIIGASVNIPVLNRDATNPFLFNDPATPLTITENGNTYLTSDLINILFRPVWSGGNIVQLVADECYDQDNLPNVDTSTYGNASRFIDELISMGDEGDTPNLRITLSVLNGPGDFSSTTGSSGNMTGKIESAVLTITTTTIQPTTTTFEPTTTVEPTTTIPETTTTTSAPPTVVDLSQFKLIPGNKKVTILWDTATEVDNAGFNIYRADSDPGKYGKINNSLIPAEGTSTQGAHYEFEDYGLKNRVTYYYILEDVDIFGKSTYHGPIAVTPRWIYLLTK